MRSVAAMPPRLPGGVADSIAKVHLEIENIELEVQRLGGNMYEYVEKKGQHRRLITTSLSHPTAPWPKLLHVGICWQQKKGRLASQANLQRDSDTLQPLAQPLGRNYYMNPTTYSPLPSPLPVQLVIQFCFHVGFNPGRNYYKLNTWSIFVCID